MPLKAQSSGRVTLGEVAARAGVSVPTASKVMNGRSDVREETRLRVAQAARALGYRQRRREPSGRRTVLIVFDTLTSPYALQILDGAVAAARRADVSLMVTSGGHRRGDDPEVLSKQWLEDAADRGVTGVIAVTWPITDKHARWSKELDLPLIVIDPESSTADSSLVAISATNWAGGSSAVAHLVGLGHRRIAVAAGPEGSVPARERVQGYRSGLEQAGIPFVPELVFGDSFTFEGGQSALEHFMALPEPPTAIFAVSDAVALGVLRAALGRGLRVPEELSIVSFDDTMMAAWSNPQLTAVSQPLFSMGQVAVERMLALAADPGLFRHPFQLETTLVERESTGPAPR